MNQFLVYLLVLLLACIQGKIDPAGKPLARDKVVVDLSAEIQTIHSFGASDCWSAKFIGKWEDESKKNQIADLLFSLDTLPNGQPKGIGLSLWRVNIGAGSFEQGEASNIRDEWRREECYQNAQGQYDWSKQAGSQWFLKATRQRGVAYTLGFSNSPPVHMTLNGKAYSPGGSSLNLKPEKFTDFAQFLTEVSRHFEFDYLSPVNEPQWDWAAGKEGKANQEGSPARTNDLVNIAKALSDKVAASGSKTKITMGEAGQLDFLYEKAESGRGNQLAELFSANGNSIKNLPGVEPIMAYHSYFTTCDDTKLVNMRQKAVQAAKLAGNPVLWQSEFGVLGDICGKYNGYPRNTGIDYGLYVAKVIHHDLTVANVTSWQWWLAVNPYDYSDGLVYINGPDGQYKDHNQARLSGQVVDSKQLWAFGNFARFIRPGMKRINVQFTNNPSLVQQAGKYMLSAYKDEATKKIVLVGINLTDQDINLDLIGVKVKGNLFTSYITNHEKNLAKGTTAGNKILLGPTSVTTLVGYY